MPLDKCNHVALYLLQLSCIMTAPERSLSEIFQSMGVAIEGGSMPEKPRQRIAEKYSEVKQLNQRLANQFLAGANEVAMPLDRTAIRFLIDQGIGSEFILRVNPATNKLRPDGKTIDIFATVDLDTDETKEELRVSVRSDKSLIVPSHIDPHKAEDGKINPENVNVVLGSVTTLDRGLHSGTKARTTQPGHNLSVIGANMPGTLAGHNINKLDKSQQAHFTDIKQQKGGEGLIASLSENNNERNLLPELVRFGPFSALSELPKGVANFQIVIPDFLLQKEPIKTGNSTVSRSEHRWDGDINMQNLLDGKIKLIDINDPKSVVQIQEIAFAQVIRAGVDTVNSYTSNVQRGLSQKGY